MRARRAPSPAATKRGDGGLRLLTGDPVLRVTLGAAVLALACISASLTIEVFYVRDVVGAGGAGFALVIGGWTAGMVLGAVGVSTRVKAPLAAAGLVALAIQGGGMAAAAVWAVLPWVIAGFFVGGIGHGVKNVLLRTLIQQRVPADAHGRAFAAYGAARNTAELGALGLGGVLVGLVGAQPALLIAGLGPMFAGLIGLAVLGASRIPQPATIGSNRYASIWKFEGDPDRLAAAYAAFTAELPGPDLQLALLAPDGLVVVDTCPTRDDFVAFTSTRRCTSGWSATGSASRPSSTAIRC